MNATLTTAAVVSLALLASGASAQTVGDCDWRASAQAIAEPWQDNTRTFSNGKTRLTLTDTIEPGAGAFHLVILSPPYSELGDRQCRVLSYDGSIGFAGVAFQELSADYDPARGLLFDVPVQYYDAALGDTTGGWLSFELNQASGAISAYIGPAE